MLTSLSEQALEYIVGQVELEGYHAERCSSFGGMKTKSDVNKIVDTINAWALSAGLRVSFNLDHDICVFEQQEP